MQDIGEERTMPAALRNLEGNNALSDGNLNALCDAYGYGTVTPMHALKKVLTIMYNKVIKGETIKVEACQGTFYIQNKENLEEFTLKYFHCKMRDIV